MSKILLVPGGVYLSVLAINAFIDEQKILMVEDHQDVFEMMLTEAESHSDLQYFIRSPIKEVFILDEYSGTDPPPVPTLKRNGLDNIGIVQLAKCPTTADFRGLYGMVYY